jgi:hypothetical protein
MKRLILASAFAALYPLWPVVSNSGQTAPSQNAPQQNPVSLLSADKKVDAPTADTYSLLAWSELGMHCDDGKDYSIFAILPPYNVVHAQLIKIGEPPVPITSGVKVTYQAMADPTGSINTISSTKTNFWDYARKLFLARLRPDVGLAGYKVQSLTPNKMSFITSESFWEALGIPTVNYDDNDNFAPLPMARIVAKNAAGTVLAQTSVVLSVSDEISCNVCHASNSDPAAMPARGWVNDPDPWRDTKLNILLKHDDRFDITPYLAQLRANGYKYRNTLYATATRGTPVLCAACHSDNALGFAGLPGIGAEASDMHTLHGPQILQSNGLTLDQNSAISDANSCYLCHPGQTTKCKRGAMNATLCSSCHGDLTYTGMATRNPWIIEPACQMCHNTSQRFATAFDATGQWRQTTDRTFATNDNVPVPGANLYRFSTGHGGVFCSACHGSPHAEYPSLDANDNVAPIALQGYAAKITECSVCHTNGLTTNTLDGPHGIHAVGQGWVTEHHDYVDHHGSQACAYCHGADYRGLPLSATKVARTFRINDGQQRSFPADHQFSCYDCHNGPGGDSPSGKGGEQVQAIPETIKR